MRIDPSEIYQNGRKLLFRCAEREDAQLLVDYLKKVSEETRFLLCDPDEIHYTREQEVCYIDDINKSDQNLMLLAFVDGEYAGNASMNRVLPSRRNAHRVELGIALFQKFTGQGIGTLLLNKMLEEAKKAGYEQAELTVVSTNQAAHQLYRRLGFVECGRIPNANRYQDGSFSDDIQMVRKL